MLTLLSRSEEGHLTYRSQSDYPAKGTTLGGSTDDPRREHTRNATARHEAGGGRWCEHGLSRSRQLAHVVLSVAATLEPLRRGRAASPAAARPSGPRAAAGPGRGAATAGGGDRRGDVGSGAPGQLCPASLAAAGRGEHGATAAAPPRSGHAPAAAAGARASQRDPGRTADRTHAAGAVATAAWSHAPCRRRAPRRVGVSRHLLHRAPQRESARCGRSPRVTRRVRTGWRASCRRSRLRPPPPFCATSWCLRSSVPVGRWRGC